MNRRTIIVLLSGRIGAGKSSAAECLVRGENRAMHIKTSTVLANRVATVENAKLDRTTLFAEGEKLDKESPGWLSGEVKALVSDEYMTNSFGRRAIVVDAVRSAAQVNTFRDAFTCVLHVHITCELKTARHRIIGRNRDIDNGVSAAVATMADAVNMSSLQAIADLVIINDRMRPEDVATIIDAHINRVRGKSSTDRLVDVLVGGQYGSEGKGFVMQHIAPEYGVLCRVGGPNAGHSVTHPMDGRKVSFYHLPSGLMHAPRADILIGPGAVINPEVFHKEANLAESLGFKVWDRLMVDNNAMIIDPSHIDGEKGIVQGIGSTGQGVGAATIEKIKRNGARLAGDYGVDTFNGKIGDTREYLERRLECGVRVMMEGTQGTGLSLHHGHYPFVTSRDTTVSGTLAEMGIPPGRVNRSIMVCRTNPIRVQSPNGGSSGPMGHEITWENVAARIGGDPSSLRETERTTTTKRLRRVAEFDFTQLRRAVLLNAPTDIAVTFVDYINRHNSGAQRWEQLTDETHRFIEIIETVARAPVSMISTGFAATSFIDRRRSW